MVLACKSWCLPNGNYFPHSFYSYHLEFFCKKSHPFPSFIYTIIYLCQTHGYLENCHFSVIYIEVESTGSGIRRPGFKSAVD